jgi:electron transfer flavoprotein beta subunit
MKILVCISNVPDTTTKITFTDNNKVLNSAGVQFIINPYDEIAITRALELKEASGGTVTIINVGRTDTEANIRKALAIGADDAIRVNADPLDAFYIASQIAHIAKSNNYDIILTGKESIDYNGSQVSGMIAELLDLPSINVATKLSVEGTTATLEREIDGGKEIVSTPLPFVASAQKGMAEPRIPNMRGIMSARTKPLQVVEPIDAATLSKVIVYDLPKPKAACRMVSADNPAELVELLHNEAKII